MKKFLPEQILVFTTSRAQVQYYAKKIHEWLERDTNEPKESLHYDNKRLMELSIQEVAFYHAGLTEKDKQAVVNNFKNGALKILVSTSSLAWGVNLPAKAVIIMDIDYTTPLTGKEPMSSADILQMLGRAGRPQYHTKGYGYILTNEKQRQKLEIMLEGKAPVVSNMNEYLSELVIQHMALKKDQILTRLELIEFFEQSFLMTSRFMSEEEFEEELEKTIAELKMFKLIAEVGEELVITKYGLVTSRFFINPGTAGNLVTVKPQDRPEEMIPPVVEFKDLPVRRNEKKFLRSLGATPKTYRDYKLQYVIGVMVRKERLEQEFMQDGVVLYKEYRRIQSFYNYIKKIK